MTIAANTDLLTIARRVGLEAGALAARRRAEGVEVAATKSSIVDVVTLADREVEAYVRAAIADVRPDDGFLGEESTGTTGGSGLTWIVDPIDGTVNYLYGIPVRREHRRGRGRSRPRGVECARGLRGEPCER